MPAKAVYLETFGCQMNELDSELVSGSLRALGYRFVTDPNEAEVVLYNTCSVREHAEQKVWSRLGEMAIRKARQPQLVVGVLGCMAEREGDALLRRMPVVDIMVGPGELDKLPGLLDNAVRTRAALLDDHDTIALAATPETERPDVTRLRSARESALQGNTNRRSGTLAAAADTLELLDLSRAISPTDHAGSAYVRITRGCNKFCTYCVVPFTRGAEVHRPPDHIVDECKRLADAGVIEVTLLGQTVNHYRFEHGASVSIGGVVQPQKGRAYTHASGVHQDPYAGENVTTFGDLLVRIHEEVPGIQRLRFVTSFPRSFGDDVLAAIRDHPRICRYLHVPAQSGSNRMLQLMNRGYTVEEYLEFLDRARAFLHQPHLNRPLTLAGDIIVGFPGETEEDFAATRDLIIKARYKNCFIFKYSPRPGTIAIDRFADDIPEAVKRRRNNDLLSLQNRISEDVGREFVGMTLPAMVEGVSRRELRKAAGVGTSSPASPPPAAQPQARNASVPLTIGGKSADPGPPDHAASACSLETAYIFDPSGPNPGPSPEGRLVQMSARTEGDLIVFFDHPAGRAPELVGSVQRFRVTDSLPLALTGELLPPT